MKYRKKPVVVEAYQTDKEMDIETLEGTMHASVGDYIITGVRGEQYPCKPDIFEQTYEPADAPTASPWRRVEDELPRGQELVIVAVKDTAGDTPFWYTQCGWITTDGEYWIVDNEICDYVVAWMPLPEPPKEEA